MSDETVKIDPAENARRADVRADWEGWYQREIDALTTENAALRSQIDAALGRENVLRDALIDIILSWHPSLEIAAKCGGRRCVKAVAALRDYDAATGQGQDGGE